MYDIAKEPIFKKMLTERKYDSFLSYLAQCSYECWALSKEQIHFSSKIYKFEAAMMQSGNWKCMAQNT